MLSFVRTAPFLSIFSRFFSFSFSLLLQCAILQLKISAVLVVCLSCTSMHVFCLVFYDDVYRLWIRVFINFTHIYIYIWYLYINMIHLYALRWTNMFVYIQYTPTPIVAVPLCLCTSPLFYFSIVLRCLHLTTGPVCHKRAYVLCLVAVSWYVCTHMNAIHNDSHQQQQRPQFYRNLYLCFVRPFRKWISMPLIHLFMLICFFFSIFFAHWQHMRSHIAITEDFHFEFASQNECRLICVFFFFIRMFSRSDNRIFCVFCLQWNWKRRSLSASKPICIFSIFAHSHVYVRRGLSIWVVCYFTS